MTVSPRLPELEHPDLSSSEREALAEFWGVYEEHFDEITDAVEEDARGHPEPAGTRRRDRACRAVGAARADP